MKAELKNCDLGTIINLPSLRLFYIGGGGSNYNDFQLGNTNRFKLKQIDLEFQEHPEEFETLKKRYKRVVENQEFTDEAVHEILVRVFSMLIIHSLFTTPDTFVNFNIEVDPRCRIASFHFKNVDLDFRNEMWENGEIYGE